jgi:OOP family OmpA-OmpF porin
MKKTILAIAAVTSLLASSAFAQGYAGVAVGQGHVNLDCSGTTSCSDNGTGFKVFGGYKFTPNIAAEVTYFDFGKASAAAPGLGLDLRTTALGVGAAFMADFAPQWSGVARLGVASVRMKGDATLFGASGSTSESSTQAYVGLGVGYEISKGLSVNGSMDFSRGKIAGETGNIRLISVGLTQAF